MKTERDAFEEWYSSAYSETIHMLPNGQYSSLRCQHSWGAWTASAQREGYKLMPVEPTMNMCNQLSSNVENAKLIYKAMIGAIE